MKILFFLEYYYPNIGGVETLFKNLIDNLAQENHKITIITARPYPDSPLKEKDGNITIIRIPVRSRYIFTFLGFFYLIRHISKGDFIHTTSYNAAIPAFFAGKLFSKKVIVTFHEVWDQLWFKLPDMGKVGQWGHYLFEQFLLKLPFDKFIGVSHSTSNNLVNAGVANERVTTIYNGIDYKDFKVKKLERTNPEEFIFTYFGRLGISKGLDLLIPAAQQVCSKYPQMRLQLIIPRVPKPFLDKIMTAINTSSLKDSTIIKHELSFKDLKQTLVQSDCVVIPSYSEGFCFAAAECIALGVPLISSDQTALKEVVSGQFIKMENFSEVALIKAMEAALAGDWETTPIKQFLLTDTIDQYKTLYDNLMQVNKQQIVDS